MPPDSRPTAAQRLAADGVDKKTLAAEVREFLSTRRARITPEQAGQILTAIRNASRIQLPSYTE